MNPKKVYIVSMSVLSVACSTSRQVQSLKPMASYSKQVVYDKQVSYVQMPVEVSISDVQSQTNKYLNGLIYEDTNLADDDLEMKVWKQSDILITERDGKLHLELPLKIWSRYRYGVEKLGVSAHDTREVNLNGIVKISSAVKLDNWKLHSETQVEEIEWKESPTVTVMGKNMPITYLINPAISMFKGKMGKMIDESIEKSFDLKSYVVSAIEAVSKPILVNEQYNAWFAMLPMELYATKAVIGNKKMMVNVGMKAFLETSVGSKPNLTFEKNKLSLLAVDKMPNEFNANIAAFITYADAASLIQKNFWARSFGQEINQSLLLV